MKKWIGYLPISRISNMEIHIYSGCLVNIFKNRKVVHSFIWFLHTASFVNCNGSRSLWAPILHIVSSGMRNKNRNLFWIILMQSIFAICKSRSSNTQLTYAKKVEEIFKESLAFRVIINLTSSFINSDSCVSANCEPYPVFRITLNIIMRLLLHRTPSMHNVWIIMGLMWHKCG